MQMTPAFVAGMDDSFVKVGISTSDAKSSSSSAPGSPALPSSGTLRSNTSSNGHRDGALSPTASKLRAAVSAVATSSPSYPTSPALGGPASTSMSRASSRRSSIESEDSPQRRAIREAFLRRDVEELKLLSNKGFLNDAMRRLVWPMILRAQNIVLPHIQEEEILRRRRRFSIAERIEEKPVAEEKAEKEGIIEGDEDEKADVRRKEDIPHKDEYQVHLDVERSFFHFSMDQNREKLRGQLNSIIIDTLRKYPSLHYFQGYHDIVSVILLVADDDIDLAHRMTVQISLFHIRDSMMEGLEPVIGYLRLLKRILAQADPALANAVEQAASLPYFSLSWVLTLLSHDLTSMDLTCRIFDFLLSHNPAMVAYLCAALVMAKKADLEALDPDIANDPATLHTTLSKLPNLTLDPPLRAASVPAPTRSRTASRPPSRAPSTPPSRAGSRPGSRPGSPRLGATSSGLPSHIGDMSLGSGTWERLMEEEAYGSGGDTSPGRGRSARSRHATPPPPVSLETIFTNAVRLSAAYPLDHPKIRARTIFGPLSTVFTWENQNLTDVEAEQIVREGKDVIIPEVDPSSTGDAAKEKRDEESLKKNWQTLERRFFRGASSLSLELSNAFNTSLKNWNSGSTFLALVGLAGLLVALYGKNISPPLGLAGIWKGRQNVSSWLFGARTAFAPWLKSRFWWSENWLVRWVLTKNL